METTSLRPDLMPDTIPTAMVAIMFAAVALLWFFSHRWRRGRVPGWGHLGLFVGYVIVGTLALWLGLQTAGRFVLLASIWPLWLHALTGAAAVETAIVLYALERRVTKPHISKIVIVLRVVIILLVAAILVQPVRSFEFDRSIDRHLYVLVDDSQSMHFVDRHLTPSERLKVAALFDDESVEDYTSLDGTVSELARIHRRGQAEVRALEELGESDALAAARLESSHDALKEGKAVCGKAADAVGAALGAGKALDDRTKKVLQDVGNRLKSDIVATMDEALDKGAADRIVLRDSLNRIVAELGEVLKVLPGASTLVDDAFYKGLDDVTRQRVDAAAETTRAAMARQVLLREDGGSSFLELAGKEYYLHVVQFASKQREVDVQRWIHSESNDTAVVVQEAVNAPEVEAEKPDSSTPDEEGEEPGIPTQEEEGEEADTSTQELAFRERTDITGALEHILDETPPESLAGVLVLTDGRHNGEAGVVAVARRLGIQDSPVCCIVLGGTRPPMDASILALHAPDRVFLGDRLRVVADLKLDGLRGKQVKVSLLHDDTPVEEREVDVPENDFRTSVRFVHEPKEQGITRYALQISAVEGEIFKENNRWGFDVAITDDRTNVLLVDAFPRWEFRYLRNLFYGRDKSVHLQYVLLEPDTISGSSARRVVHASATRKFGDAEATALPKSREEWLKFDVIILGDVPSRAISPIMIEDIRHCVAERGAMLVVIAGPRAMPHDYTSSVFREMLPVNYVPSADGARGLEDNYRVAVTPQGRNHPVMMMSDSSSETMQIWDSLPEMYWRQRVDSIKEGASILAYAKSVKEDDGVSTSLLGGSVDATARRLAEQMERRTHNALIVAHKYAMGRVLMLNFDRTWRLRYRVGDKHHHRFWGQVLRWGAGENLRAGTDLVRLGTDRLTYTPDEPVLAVAKLMRESHKPVEGDRLVVTVFRGDQSVSRKQLEYRADSNGIYEGVLGHFRDPGRYRIELQGKEAGKLLAQAGLTKVETEFVVVNTRNPVELSELTADPGTAAQLAGQSGGVVAKPMEVAALLDVFGAGSQTVRERRETTLWDSWILFLLITFLITGEWILRKRGGLI